MMLSWNGSLTLIGYLLLNLVHGFYYIYLLIYLVYCEFLRKTRFLYHNLILTSKDTSHVYSMKDSYFHKLPKHLAIIIGSECVQYDDLVKIILWCSQLGIKFTSFYQHNNNIHPLILYEAFYKYNNRECLKKIVWSKSFDVIKDLVRKDLNGYIRPDPSELMHVNIFTMEDGMRSLVETTKLFSKTHSSKASISQNVFDSAVRLKILAPDPDLAIIFGDTYSSFGFLPWHISVTEFLNFHTHHNIRVEDFILLLDKYSHCEQRFGK